MTAPERPGEAIDDRRRAGRLAGRSACVSSASSSSLMPMGEHLPPAGPRPACREWACGSARSPLTPSAAELRPLCRPASTWQAKDFPSCMLTFCSATREVRSLALPPTTWPAYPQWNGRPTWWITRPPTMSGRILRRHHRARLDPAACRPDRHPAAVDDAALGGQLRAQLDEHLRLQFIEPGVEPAHRPAQVVLGEPVGRGHHGELGLRRRHQPVERSRECAHAGRTRLLGIEQVADRRLEGLVMRRQGAVLGADGSEEPGNAVGLHDERIVAGDGRHAGRAGRRPIVGRLARLEVRPVKAHPEALLGIPPDELLPLRPGPALGIGRGAVEEDATVIGPGEPPVRLERIVGTPPLACPVAARLGEDAAVDPDAACRRAVVLQFREAGQSRGRPVRGSISSSLYPFISIKIFSASTSFSMRLIEPSGSRGGSS